MIIRKILLIAILVITYTDNHYIVLIFFTLSTDTTLIQGEISLKFFNHKKKGMLIIISIISVILLTVSTYILFQLVHGEDKNQFQYYTISNSEVLEFEMPSNNITSFDIINLNDNEVLMV